MGYHRESIPHQSNLKRIYSTYFGLLPIQHPSWLVLLSGLANNWLKSCWFDWLNSLAASPNKMRTLSVIIPQYVMIGCHKTSMMSSSQALAISYGSTAMNGPIWP